MPPLGADCAAPVLLPPQITLLVTVAFANKAAAGCVTVAEAVKVHPLASLMVTVYVPALNPVAVEVV